MTLYLIRHAHAGSRSAWEGDDADRPLSPRGVAQAGHLVGLLADARPAAIWSSPAVRCVQTVEPIAASAGRSVEVSDLLFEGSDAGKAVLWLVEQAARSDGDVVACSHGDLIPRAMGLLAADGLRLEGSEGPSMAKKGSMWAISLVDGRPSSARHHHPGS